MERILGTWEHKDIRGVPHYFYWGKNHHVRIKLDRKGYYTAIDVSFMKVKYENIPTFQRTTVYHGKKTSKTLLEDLEPVVFQMYDELVESIYTLMKEDFSREIKEEEGSKHVGIQHAHEMTVEGAIVLLQSICKGLIQFLTYIQASPAPMVQGQLDNRV